VTVALSYQTKQLIDDWLVKYPAEQRQSAVIFALKVVQEENGGWLTENLMDSIAVYLKMPRIAVYEVATFYSMFELNPVGKHKICVCTNISCLLKGSDEIACHFKTRLGIEFGETSEDGRFTLKEVECLSACEGAPVALIDRVYYENLTSEKIDIILAELAETE
jgi:NADH-quinone oxidoreductase subunit E